MMFVFQLVCLLITLFVLHKYIASGMYAPSHRLLPLVLGLIGVYNFYQVMWSVTGEVALFLRLKDLLVIQMLYLILFYEIDFLQVRVWKIAQYALFLLLIVADVFAFLQDGEESQFQASLQAYIFCYIIFLVTLGTYAYIRYSYTKRENRVAGLVYLGMLAPSVCLYLERFRGIGVNIIMPLSLAFTCLIALYLIQTENLADPMFALQQNMYEAMDVPIIFFDADYYYLGANRAAELMFPKELNIVPRKSNPAQYMDNVRQMARNPEQEREFEFGNKYYKCRMEVIRSHNRIRGYSITVVDITEQKKETWAMEGLKDAAVTQVMLKSRFLATMSHDLRSPLHAIIGISDVLAAKREISGHNRSLVLHIRSAGLTLLEQVDAILDFSRLEAGRLELAYRPYSLDDMAEGLSHMCVINLQSKPVRFSMKICDRHPRQFLGDEMRVREMIQNLLSNAVKFTSEGEINCDIMCRLEPEKNRACITCIVTDTGPGMSEEEMDQIFEEYISYANSKTLAGTGLGLCIVRQLAELMGGAASASSDGHSGSTVRVTFYQDYEKDVEFEPSVTFSRESILRQTAAFTRNIRPNYVYPGARVLLVDDMRINRQIFGELAAPWQFAIDFAESGQKAVEAVGRQHYDLIFLDQTMPGMTGIQAADLIRGMCDTPLVMMTADLSGDMREDCRAHGCADFLAKPIELPAFQKVIETYLPKELRQIPVVGSEDVTSGLAGSTSEAYRRTLETYVTEMEPLVKKLPEYEANDMELFRVKMHGIKGASRQIGRTSTGEAAEIMEMAAKTANTAFISSHMDTFLEELADAVEDVRREIARLPSQGKKNGGEQLAGIESSALFARMKKGFDAYRLEEIEICIRLLDQMELSVADQMLLDQARNACEELDYERGSDLLANKS